MLPSSRARPTQAWLVAVAAFLLLTLAIGGCGSTGARNEPSPALAAITDVAAGDARLAAVWTTARGSFVRGADDRHVESRRGLEVRAPDTAEGDLEVGVSRFERLALRVRLEGASASPAKLEGGIVVYEEVQTATDRVLAANDTALEELLVLRSARAPRAFAWKIHVPERGARVRERAGGLVFEDERGHLLVAVPPLRAWDANGNEAPLDVRWDAAAATLHAALRAPPKAWPVVIDPKFETSSWFDAQRSRPLSRDNSAAAFDAGRNELVMFGGGGGRNDTWIWNGATWAQRTPADPPPTRISHAMAYDAVRREVVLFGGIGNGSKTLADTWVWNGATWTQRMPALSPPPQRGHALVFDSVRSETVLVGGGETWVWNGTTWTKRLPAVTPGTGQFARGAFDAVRGEVVVFGGLGAGYLSETWVWNGITWARRMPPSSPSGRAFYTIVYDAARAEVILFGGDNFTVPLRDTWAWNGTTWTQRMATSALGQGGAAAYDSARGEIVLFDDAGTTWAWNGAAWISRTAQPAPRSQAGMTYDRARSEIVMFGGYGGVTAFANDTWVWNGARWDERLPVTRPPARSGHRLTFDVARSQVVLFGGTTQGPVVGDTWVWDGTTWTQRTPSASPSARTDFCMDYDAARSEVVLFGGYLAGGTHANDTWTWNGVTWLPRTPGRSPSARSGGTFAYDEARSEIVMFGGTSPASLTDTWVWDGITWTQRFPAASPAARSGAKAVYESSRGEIFLFGGSSVAPGAGADSWVWNGVTWTQRFPAVFPSSRSSHAMAYDRAHDTTVLFGGFGASTGFTGLDDTWLHATLGGSCAVDADCLDAFCTDGVCCGVKACAACETCAGTSPGRCAPVTNREDPDSCSLATGKSCDDVGVCKAALGTPATNAASCASGFLVDGVCCDQACTGGCQACRDDLKESGERNGSCGSAKAGTDPHDGCAEDPRASCRQDGTCDGRGACRLHRANTACGEATCLGTRSSSRVCDGLGTCSATIEGIDCGAYSCNEVSGCALSCTTNAECARLHHCESGQCVADRGAVCDGNTIVSANGDRDSCGLYVCVGAACVSSCKSNLDCVGDADCTPDGICVRFEKVGPGEESGCRSSGRNARGTLGYAGLVLAALAWLRRKRGVQRFATR